MKRKMWMRCLLAAAVLLVLCAGVRSHMVHRGLGLSTGRFLLADNGTPMVIVDDRSPICLSVRTGREDLFASFDDGDRILVLHDGIQETYPGRTGAYGVLKLEDGTEADLPADVLAQLTQMGWLR